MRKRILTPLAAIIITLSASACEWPTEIKGPTEIDDCVWDIWHGCSGNKTDPFAWPMGSLVVTTVTTGVDLDPDGYRITFGLARSRFIVVNGAIKLTLNPDEHSVELIEVADNCSVGDDNPRSVIVAGDETAETTFNVTCVSL